jgi:hypothetical protein
VRLFETDTLLYKATLPRPHADDPEYARFFSWVTTLAFVFMCLSLSYVEANDKKLPDVKSVVRRRCRIAPQALYRTLTPLSFLLPVDIQRRQQIVHLVCGQVAKTKPLTCIICKTKPLTFIICDSRLTFFCRSIVVFNITNVKAVTRVYSSMCGLLPCPAECFRHPTTLLPQ